MRLALLACMVFLGACTSLEGDFEKAVSFGVVTEVNDYSNQVDKSLYVRMYQAPVYEEQCFIETHGVCKYQYYLSVATFDEYPQTNLFTLTHQGEVTDINWLSNDEIDTATLQLTMSNYTAAALKNNPSLPVKKEVLRVTLTPHQIDEHN
ncbi:hypothetical protein CWC31_15250 [Pseudoalteromonas ruthenica]|uniref:hypothetical protein n=1 Tax=Pseudoalteromonas ruthenica TaxID=151081 RepID=UPI0011085429|nr:hypothetical protein [Pseudoalteromonas ruthenica]TLX49819.1 hypothetical protein CWC31_15250 [Pseudoalteromonas ruthenica]